MNNDIEEYVTSSGKKRYKFHVYAGRDERTGNPCDIRKRGYKTADEAQKAYLAVKAKVANGDYSPEKQDRQKFKEVYKQWLTIYADTVKESTLATTERIIKKHVLPDLGNFYIDRIRIINCQKAVNKWFKVAPKTYKRYIRYANQVFNYAIHLELIKTNPMEKVIRPKCKQTKRKFKFYTKDQLSKYLSTAYKFKKEAYAYFFVLAYTGLRRGEALALEWSDIDFNKRSLTVRRTASKGLNNRNIIQTPKTVNSQRTIYLDNDTIEVLKRWRSQQNKLVKVVPLNARSFVFNGWLNNYPANIPLGCSTVNYWNTVIAKKANVEHIRIHDFRHTHASLLFDSGASMQDVKERLGHASIKTTMDIYTHLPKKRREETISKFSEYMES